jgi:hypothetical protein
MVEVLEEFGLPRNISIDPVTETHRNVPLHTSLATRPASGSIRAMSTPTAGVHPIPLLSGVIWKKYLLPFGPFNSFNLGSASADHPRAIGPHQRIP